jgi:hypothetical protein
MPPQNPLDKPLEDAVADAVAVDLDRLHDGRDVGFLGGRNDLFRPRCAGRREEHH